MSKITILECVNLRPLFFSRTGRKEKISLNRKTDIKHRLGDRILAKLSGKGKKCKAEFIRNIQNSTLEHKPLIAMLEQGSSGLIIPGKKRPWQIIPDTADGKKFKAGDIVIANAMPRRRAKVEKVIGTIAKKGWPTEVTLSAYDIEPEFPKNVLDAADKLKEITVENAAKHRVSMLDIPFITVDGKDAKDFDDAVAAWYDKQDNLHLVVAIADVTAYVKENDELDLEARKRGTSIYFPDRVVPMLPPRLSEDLCSLRPQEIRPCLACHMQIDKEGQVQNSEFKRGLLRSQKRLTYQQVEKAMLEGMPADWSTDIKKNISCLHDCWKRLFKARINRNALELETSEIQIVLDNNAQPTKISPREKFETHRWIEDMMIAANVEAAKLLNSKRTWAMRRIHEAPAPSKISELKESLAALGYNISNDIHKNPAGFINLLQEAKNKNEGQIVSNLILRCQSKAHYAPDDYGHYGLALRRYCHFTSPIRRYPDIMIHRQIISSIIATKNKKELDGNIHKKLEKIGEQQSASEVRAMQAERDANDRYSSLFLAQLLGEKCEAVVTNMHRVGLFVKLIPYGVDALLENRSRPWSHRGTRRKTTNKNIKLGTVLQVIIQETDPVLGRVRVRLAKEQN